MTEQELAESIRAVAENVRQPVQEKPTEEAKADPQEFRTSIVRLFEMADATVRDARQTREENAYLKARNEQEEKAHARTMEMLKAAELTNTELRQQLSDTREVNVRLNAHMELMGSNLLSAARSGTAS